MEDGGPLLSIGELARRARLPVRTIRFWSDAGVLPPAARTGGGRRLYDAACVARLELVVTLRELGLGLPDVRRVLDGQVNIAEVAAVHLEALDAQIRALRLHRAVLAVVLTRTRRGVSLMGCHDWPIWVKFPECRGAPVPDIPAGRQRRRQAPRGRPKAVNRTAGQFPAVNRAGICPTGQPTVGLT